MSNAGARILSAVYNYNLNRRFVFHTEGNSRTAMDYIGLAVGIFILNNIILSTFVNLMSIPAFAAKLLTEFILFLISWTVQNKLIFRQTQYDRGNKEESVRGYGKKTVDVIR